MKNNRTNPFRNTIIPDAVTAYHLKKYIESKNSETPISYSTFESSIMQSVSVVFTYKHLGSTKRRVVV